LLRYPPICISNLLETKNDGIYIVGGVVEDLVDPEAWWYAACSCLAIVSNDSGAYYCHDCLKPVSKMVPRCVL
jgi:CDP-diglyceride synthetase